MMNRAGERQRALRTQRVEADRHPVETRFLQLVREAPQQQRRSW